MSGAAYKCGKCDGHGVLLINISSNEEGSSYIENVCDHCNGTGYVSKAQLMDNEPDIKVREPELIAIPVNGALRVYMNGKTYQRPMSSRQLYKLAHYALSVAIDTEAYELESK